MGFVLRSLEHMRACHNQGHAASTAGPFPCAGNRARLRRSESASGLKELPSDQEEHRSIRSAALIVARYCIAVVYKQSIHNCELPGITGQATAPALIPGFCQDTWSKEGAVGALCSHRAARQAVAQGCPAVPGGHQIG